MRDQISPIDLRALAIGFLVFAVNAAAAWPAAADTLITDPTCPVIISEPGDYRLATDLQCTPGVDGIVILSSDVTLRLDDHRISGSEVPGTCSSGTGIRVGSAAGTMLSGIRVREGTIDGFRFGFLAENVRSSQVRRLTVTVECPVSGAITVIGPGGDWRIRDNTTRGPADTTSGIGIGDSDGNLVVGNDVNNTISLVNSSRNLIVDNKADVGGILLDGASRHNLIKANTANDGIFVGIGIGRGATENTVIRNTALGNALFDLFDGNPGCDANLWRENEFATANQPCIASDGRDRENP
jgi:parallel beta-helix repeat protein